MDEPSLDLNYLIDRSADPEDQREVAYRRTICAIIWQAYMDLVDESHPKERWDAQYYFHDRSVFDEQAVSVGFDPQAMREKLIKRGLLPAELPPPPPSDV